MNGISIEGTGKFLPNGNFDATGEILTFKGAGTLKIGSTVTLQLLHLVLLDAAAGTVWYDGALTIVTDDYIVLKSRNLIPKPAGTINEMGFK
ncbi:MAG: hypothetical protein CM15mP65_18120 [Crocinitomicaceae bacterium]|nr:MAG: hypothetical protein CM15mP65_18120 [Crocinitomicaceae bacterium]